MKKKKKKKLKVLTTLHTNFIVQSFYYQTLQIFGHFGNNTSLLYSFNFLNTYLIPKTKIIIFDIKFRFYSTPVNYFKQILIQANFALPQHA